MHALPRGQLLDGPGPGPSGTWRGHRGRHRQAPGHLRQHPRPRLLRPGRRCDQPRHVLDQVLPPGVHRPLRKGRLPLRSLPVHPLGRPCARDGRQQVTVTSNTSGGAAPAPIPEDLVTVTIDGFRIQVPKGTLLIRAAELLGIQIPRFCEHPLLDPIGACRQCLVEIPDMGNGRGMPKPQASCTITEMRGMVVNSLLTSPVADKAQRGVMEFLLINHPLDCPVCDKGGECPLQNQAMSTGQGESQFLDVKRTWPKPISLSTQVLLDRERCIQGTRCTRFASEIAGDPLIELMERGAQEEIGISESDSFDSYFSANTVQIWPVGALTGSAYRFRSRPFDLVSTPSICEHCAGGSAQRTDHRRGKVTRRLAGDDPEVNEEWNCDKGRWAFTYATQPDRLTRPLVRDEDSRALEFASWPEAVSIAAQGLS